MRVKFDPDSDILLVTLRDDAPEDAIEVPGGLIVDYGQGEVPIAIEVLDASKRGIVPDRHLRVTLES